MFKKMIDSSPLVNEIANGVLGNISGDDFRGDISTVTTLRCFFGKKLTEGQGINVRISTGAVASVENVTNSVVRNYAPFGLAYEENYFWIHSLTGSSDENDQMIAALREEFPAQFPGYKENNGIAAFYKNSFRVICFYNEELHNVIVFVGNLTYRKLHFLQASFIPMFPFYRDKEKRGATEMEADLIRSLTKDDASEYMACVRKFADQWDFREEGIRRRLAGFETRFEELALEGAKNEINSIDARIEQLHASIEENLVARNDKLTYIYGLEAKIAKGQSEPSEIMEYFLCNKKLGVVSVDSSKLVFTVTGHLEYFDKEAALSLLKNERSALCAYGENVRRLMKAVLIDETIRIRMCSMFTLNLNGSVSAHKGANYANNGIVGYIPNPHLNHYSCLGNNTCVINEMLMRHDYIGAIEQCVAANKNWNVLDSIVTRDFASDIASSPSAFIELPNGRVVDLKTAIKWLDENEGKHDEEKKEE